MPRIHLTFSVEASTGGRAEVGASTGVGEMLSQQEETPAKLHPCPLLSKKFTPAERNYEIGHCELLEIKLALEEWRHLLEGTRPPFTVLTDHKSLEYLKGCQKSEPLSSPLGTFLFKIPYISQDPKNVKAEALSRLHTPDQIGVQNSSPESGSPFSLSWV